jgi:adenylate cyclase
VARDHRRLAAIVSADVVGYSRLMGRDESGTLAALKGHRGELIDPKITEYGGRIVKTMGDGLLLEFPSVVDAVRCAVDVQRGMAERNAGLPPEQRIDFRIGVNVGDIIIDGEDIFGDGVNVAARLQALADPGGICVSRVVRDQVLDKLNFVFEDLGAHELKNIARPIEAYRIRDEPTDGPAIQPRSPPVRGPTMRRLSQASGWPLWIAGFLALGLAGIAIWFLVPLSKISSEPTPPVMSVAIVPFAAPGGSPAEARFAEALTQDITTLLSKDSWIHVVAQGLVTTYTAKPFDPRSVGRELKVRYLVDGEVRRAGSRIAVTMHLIDVDTGANAWSDRLELEAERPPQEQNVPTRRLGRRLGNAIIEAEERNAEAHPRSDSAWNLFLRTAAAARRWEEPRLEPYDKVLQLDPNFAPALAAKAEIIDYQLRNDSGLDQSRIAHAKDELDRLSRRAVEIDRNDSSAWRARARALARLGRWDEALAANATAQAIEPFSTRQVARRADILLSMGRPDEALAEALRAIAMDTEAGWEWGLPSLVCRANQNLGRYADALPACEQAAALDNDWRHQLWLAAVYAQQGDMAKAAIAKTELLRRKPGVTIASLKATPDSDNPAYLQQLETNVYAGLRKVGIPEK